MSRFFAAHVGLVVALALCLSLKTVAVAGEHEPADLHVAIVEHGIYTAALPADGQVLSEPVLQKKTWRVPLVPGTLFGIRYALSGKTKQPVPLVVRLIHPRDGAPAGSLEAGWYDTQQAVEPGSVRFQGQYLAPGSPARPGRYLFQVRSGERVLAEREFEVYEAETEAQEQTGGSAAGNGASASSVSSQGEAPASLWLEREHGRCRNLDAGRLGIAAGGRTVAPEHSFALQLPKLGKVCFLTLSGGKGDRYVLLDVDNDVLAAFDSDEPGIRTRAVGFADVGNDGLPDIVILGQRRGAGARPANHIWRGRPCGRGLCWSTDTEAGKAIATSVTFAEAMDTLKGTGDASAPTAPTSPTP